MERKSDWLIVIAEKKFDETIKKCLTELNIKGLSWRSFDKKDLRFYTFDGKSVQTINKISMALASTKLLGLIKIDREGMF